MNISEHKKTVGISAIFALAFGATLYYGWGQMGQTTAQKAELQEFNDAYESYKSADFTPTTASVKMLGDARDQVKALNSGLRAEFAKYRAYCNNLKLAVKPVEFQKEVRDSIAEMERAAKANGVNFVGAARFLGVNQYRNDMVRTVDEVPYRSFLLKAVNEYTKILVDAKVTSVNKFYIAELPEEISEKRRRNVPDFYPLSFEVNFSAKRGDLPAVLNQIASDKRFFYTITGIAVQSDMVVPPLLDAYQAPVELIEVASEEPDESAAPASEQSRTIAKRKLGNAEESVRVHMTMNVLYFNPKNTVAK